ncbi:MAG: sodium-dependent transporter [Gemmatimonadota bacterium]
MAIDPTGGPQRDTWGSKTAFVLAAAGSAIGLGNIWGFPTVAAQNGGAAFLVIYLLAVALIGAPVMLAELVVGRHTQRNPVGAFKAIMPGSAWWLVGGLGVLTGLMILSFYSVIAGWTLAYILKTASGVFEAGADTGAIFADLAGNPWQALLWHALFMVLTIGVVVKGVRDGIERWTKVLMPLLFVLLLLLAARAVTLSGGGAGLSFYLDPDFSQVNGPVVLAAVGQAFFSLSLGMGAMITYGSYISKNQDLESSAGWVTGFDTLIAILAGLIIFPTLFHAGLDPNQSGPGMVFVVLTSLLSTIPPAPYGGIIFGTGFFMLLAIAALTSSVSLLEVVTSWGVDEKGWTRKKAAWLIGGTAFVVGVPSALANGAVSWLSDGWPQGPDFLSFMFVVFGQYSLVLGALLISVFVAWIWGVKAAGEEVGADGTGFTTEGVWRFLIRYVCPIAILGVLWTLIEPLF